MADPGRRGPARRSRSPTPRPSGDGFLPYLPRRRDAGPAVGGPRHAGPGAPHRRPREGGHHRQRQLRPGQPRTRMQTAARSQDRGHRQGHPAARGLRAGRGRPARARLGLDVRRDAHARWSGCRRRARRSRTRTSATSTRSRATSATCCASYRQRAGARGEPGPAVDAAPGAVPRSTRSGYNKVRGKPFRIGEIDRARPKPHPRRPDVRDDRDRADPGHPSSRRRAPRTRRSLHADPEGLRVRPGGPLVPRLRRLLDPRADPEGHARLRRARRRTSCSSPASAAPAGCPTT